MRVFCHGDMVGEILPEVWMMNRYNTLLKGAVQQDHVSGLAVLTPRMPGGGR